MKQNNTIFFILYFLLLNFFGYSQKIQIKALPHIQPKINIPKVTKVHVNSNSIIVPGGNIKSDKKKEQISDDNGEINDDKDKRKKKKS